MPHKFKSKLVKAAGTASDRVKSLRTLLYVFALLFFKKPDAATFALNIDYSKSFVEMVEAGKYDNINPDITAENFPVGSGEARVVASLVRLRSKPSPEEVLAEMDRQGLRPATMAEALAFGAQYPKIQLAFPIVAFGSVWADPQGRTYVGCLVGLPGDRWLELSGLGRGWLAGYRFLGVRKQS